MKSAPMLVATALALASCSSPQPVKDRPASAPPAVKPVAVDLYVMSMCPFAVEVEQALGPVFARLGSDATLRLGFVGMETKPGEFQTLHGHVEVYGDLVQACLAAIAPAAMPALLACMADDPENIPENWAKCAPAGVDADEVKRCAEGERGAKLLSAAFKESEARGVEGSPTIYIAGKAYEGARSTGALLRALCGAYEGAKPAACEGLSEPKPIPVVVLDDARCKDCPTALGIQALKEIVPWVAPRTVDYGTPEGRVLYESLRKHGLQFLPLFLFDRAVAEDPANSEAFEQIGPYLGKPYGTWLALVTPSRFDPTAEICDNGADDDGNGKADCVDPACATRPVCRPEAKGRLDLFVMSQCPFAVRAESSLREVLAALGDRMDLRIHFIVAASAKGFESLHGEAEVAEDLRQICAAKLHGRERKYLEYVECRNRDVASSDWKPCAKGGIDARRIERCAKGKEGAALLKADAALAAELDVQGSPTWLVNNRWTFHALSARDIQKGFCDRNPGPGCDPPLSHDESVPEGGCGGR
jgi:2-hydroxychromene-2-carboxylate isomerase